jgi:hypothetical protein
MIEQGQRERGFVEDDVLLVDQAKSDQVLIHDPNMGTFADPAKAASEQGTR